MHRDSDQLDLGAVRPLTRAVRGLVLLPYYWVITSLTSGGRLARLLAQFGLLAGGLLGVLALLGVLPSWARDPAATVGGALQLTVFGYTAIRTGSIMHGLVLLSPVISFAAHAITRLSPSGGLNPGVGGLLVVGAFVVALVVLRTMPG